MRNLFQSSIDNNQDKRNALKQELQSYVLYALSKAGFFQEAAFYGGTALRIFYGLDRFSEDLDFSLLSKNPDFDLEKYLPALRSTLKTLGLNVEVQIKEKTAYSTVQSAFLKGNTIEHFLLFYPEQPVRGINKSGKIKVKFELDIDPPAGATYEKKYVLTPMPYEVNLYDLASLFAGKIHAVICRNWKNRVKGRDLYDYVFYLQKGAKFNLPHLREKLIESGKIGCEDLLLRCARQK